MLNEISYFVELEKQDRLGIQQTLKSQEILFYYEQKTIIFRKMLLSFAKSASWESHNL